MPLSPAPTPLPRPGWRTLWPALLVAGAVLSAWGNSFAGPFVYDDIPSVLMNPTIRQLWPLSVPLSPPSAGGMTVAGRAVLNLSLAVNYAISGTAVWSYHLVNLLIHIAAALTVYGLIRRTWVERDLRGALDVQPRSGPKNRKDAAQPLFRPERGTTQRAAEVALHPIALTTALFWALHPLQTESVTYIVQRAESLMGLWYLLTLYTFLRAVTSARPALWAIAAVVACALGMGTKEVMVSAPVIVFCFDRAFISGSFATAWKRHRWIHLGLAATWAALLFELLSTHGRGDGQFDPGVTWGGYVLTQFPALLHYLWLTIWPAPLIFEYGAQWITNPWSVLPSAFAVGALAVATVIACWRRPQLGFLGLFFFAILAPTSLVPGGRQTLSEHRMYLALLPCAALAAWFLWTRWGRRALPWVAIAAAAFGAVTVVRNRDYRSALALWGDTAVKRPQNPVAHHNYGMALYESGDLAGAAAQYRAAIALEPGYFKAHANLGAALLALGQVSGGIAAYRQALALQPDYEDAHYCLAQALAATGELPGAISEYRRAIALVPRDRFAHLGLARAYAQTGQLPEGIAEAEAAIRLDPLDPEPELEESKMLAQQGRLTDAVQHLNRVLVLDPASTVARDLLRRIRAAQ